MYLRWQHVTGWTAQGEEEYIGLIDSVFPGACDHMRDDVLPKDEFGPLLATQKSGDILLVVNEDDGWYEVVSNGWLQTHGQISKPVWMKIKHFESLHRCARICLLLAQNKNHC